MNIAIDPGKSGGIAYRLHGSTVCWPMPETETELNELIEELLNLGNVGDPFLVVVEKVGGYCGKGQPGSAMFTFGRGVGVIVGLLIGKEIPFREVTPQSWLKAVGAGTANGRSKTQWKRHLLDLAKKRHPGLSGLTLKTCDAVLMLDAMESMK